MRPLKNCKKEYLVYGYCAYHYLKMLDKFEKKSREAKFRCK